ncbi:4'-phosphopantetheinyl transferase family protein [Raineyella sp.]|uniref:4'-phosphopantetheinyl transferase family protein n=1 Tax=Raineyella sp. TaxID=1911550 RepID=UPI002B1FFE85|nr:4'-phosphopantetheinyl transferase superfamily protein [Raineyella sp.]MEA5153820.1 4'-phosphopantetheinyl transferase superfamily protein [Raineyella sp.]
MPAVVENSRSLIRSLVPPWVHTAEAYGHESSIVLFPAEASAIAGSVEKRRKEFAAVRACARQALESLGLPASPLVPAVDRTPRWPEGVVGSMTHCEGYCAAAVGRGSDVLALGIDAEPNLPVPEGVLSAFAGAGEVVHLRGLPVNGVAWDRLLFSAKEAAFKAWYPLTHRWLDFTDATVKIDPLGTFRVTMVTAQARHPRFPWRTFNGRWGTAATVVSTAIALRRPDRG